MKKQYIYMIVGVSIIVLALVLGWMIYLHYLRGYIWASGTGFEGKTAWNVLELLIVPIALVLFAGFFAYWDHNRQERNSTERFRDWILKDYFDRMSDLRGVKAENEEEGVSVNYFL